MKKRGVSPTVMGLDLSLTRPAMAIIPARWNIGDWSSIYVSSLVVPPLTKMGEGLSVYEMCRERYVRLEMIVQWVLNCMRSGMMPDHVFTEDYAFGQSSSSVTKLAELGGVVKVAMFNHGRTVIPVTASSARKLLLGKLPGKGAGRGAAKAAVEAALHAAGSPCKNDDEADAFACANFGLSETGHAALTLA